MMIKGKAYKKLLAKAKRYESDLCIKMQKAVEAGDLKKADQLLMLYLESFYCKFVALDKAYKKIRRRNRPAVTDPEKMAKALNPFEGSQEVVKLLMLPREDKPDHARIVWSFGLEQRALQILVAKALRPFAKLAENQFLFDGGIQNAIRAVLQYLEEGYEAIVEVDINSCYNSYNEEKVLKLLPPLPEDMVKKVIIGKHLPLSLQCSGFTFDTTELQLGDDIASDDFSEAIVEARRGIPQGSSVSPLVSDMLLATTIEQLDIPEAVRLVVYADNFLIMAKTVAEATTTALALREALCSHPAGPLSSRILNAGWAKEGFPYLGHAFKFLGNKFYVEPTTENREKFDRTYEKLLKSALNASLSAKKQQGRLAKAERYVRSWCSVFRLWDGMKEFRLERLTHTRSLKMKIESKFLIPPSAAE